MIQYIWPPILAIILLFSGLKISTLTSEPDILNFFDNLIATLIGVFLAFWLTYIFRSIIKQKENKNKLIRLLMFLKQELFLNRQRIEIFKKGMLAATKLGIIANVSPGLNEIKRSMRKDSFYSIQASGWFEVLDDNKITAKIISAYHKIENLQLGISFSLQVATDEVIRISKEARLSFSKETYPELIRKCDDALACIGGAIKLIDEGLQKEGSTFFLKD